MTQRTILLREWRPTELALNPAELTELQSLKADLTVQPMGPGQYSVTPGSHIGSVTTRSLRVSIEPKFSIDRLFYVLGYTEHAPFLDSETQLATEAEFTEGFVAAYLHLLRRRLRRGLLMGYRTVDESLHGVRGRVRTADQLRRRFAIPLPVEVTYDDYTEDIPENQLIKAALRRLEALRVTSPALRSRLAEAISAFAVVSDIRFGRGWMPHFSYTRLNEHYRPLLALSRLVVENTSLELRDGDHTATGLLFDMNTIFEDFLFTAIGRRLEPHLGPTDHWRQGATLPLDDAGTLRPQPDLSWWQGENCRFVGDAKYKHAKAGKLEDLYQLLAYCTGADLPSGLLIYAVQPEGSVSHQIVRGGPALTVTSVDLEAPVKAIEARLDQLAQTIVAASHTQSANMAAAV